VAAERFRDSTPAGLDLRIEARLGFGPAVVRDATSRASGRRSAELYVRFGVAFRETIPGCSGTARQGSKADAIERRSRPRLCASPQRKRRLKTRCKGIQHGC